MNDTSREEFLQDNDKKLDKIRKYGIKQKYEEEISSLKLLFSVILCIVFLFVIMFCLYFLSKKNEEIGKLQYVIEYKENEIIRLNSRIECLQDSYTQLVTVLKDDNNYIKEQYESFMKTLANCSMPQPIVNNYYKDDHSTHNTEKKEKTENTAVKICVIF